MNLKQLNQLYSSENLPELSIYDKVSKLELSETRIKELKKENVKEIDIEEDECTKQEIATINADLVVGTIRIVEDNSSWYDFLNTRCHKDYIFRKYNKELFENLLKGDNEDDLPSVVKKHGEYYIAGNGLHRLTIAKCLGNKQVKVIVKEKEV